MIDFLSSLPSLSGNDDLEVVEVDEAQEKRERIAFHRDHVRNGPVTFEHVTGGQVRRAKLRELRGRSRMARRSQVQSFLDQQREYATLRGLLQAVGVVAYATEGFSVSDEVRFRSARELVQRFGDLNDSDSDLVPNALQKAYDRFADLTGQERSQIQYAGASA